MFGDVVRGRTIAVAVALLFVAACSDSPGPDTTPPAAVTDLALASGTDSSLTVTWTAPGDDGERGQAASYDLRYTLGSLPAGWDSATVVTGLPLPRQAGQAETVTVRGLEPHQVYHLALKTTDDAGNVSGLSNVVEAETGDVTPPGRITDLAVAATGPLTATLTWTAPGDDGNRGRAAHYEAGFASSAITSDSWTEARTVVLPITPKAAGETEEVGLGGLPGDTTLWFAVRAVDAAGNQGAVSNSPSGYVRREPRTWEIRVDGSGDAPTIQAGIDSAADGDVVLVHQGNYYEHIDFHGRNVHVRSADGPEATIIDGSQTAGPVVVFQSGETHEASLEKLTITGGTGTTNPVLSAGGGIYCQDASPSIIANIIRDNTAGFPGRGYGGGMFVDGTSNHRPLISPLIEANVFQENKSATNGGGLTIGDADVTVRDNLFSGNECEYDGGAVYLAMGEPGTARFINNEFWTNVAGDHGGAIEAGQQGYQSPPLLIRGNLFIQNEAHGADTPQGPDTGGAISMRGWSGTIANNTFVGNIGTGISDCSGGQILVSTGDPRAITIIQNIFASGQGCGVVCRFWLNPNVQLANNIFWSNAPKDVDDPLGCFPGWQSRNLFADPLFCDPAHDDYHVRSDSPALSDTLIIGAYDTPGCGP